ncbi:bifunctional aspartate kinase/homoserine dehydrogenase I [Marilutibacter chinensis]|uniref:Bifunctional aspartokinase/homoserine dehydrogenase n=1 Tax=Marilutibacter chinensis TaxID=2912247 RepID=A0ABS9HWG9_9GAMM|nr:bifunctional aspartate kinase/homoserine dehydrogenase I [Lysobacter chinensis]MCF7223240.1 bifunctional aspartate kinase/homoserine dehydrogenase I [Lysobacter chinensis]
MSSPNPSAHPTPPAAALVATARLRRHAHKFGGSSLADADRQRAAAALVADGADGADSRIVVVSAMQGVTDALVALADAARDGRDWQTDWDALAQRHLAAADALLADGSGDSPGLKVALARELDALCGRLAGLAAGAGDEADVAWVHGLGEVLSSHLLHAALGGEAAGWARLDAREVLCVHPGELGVAVDWTASREQLAQWRQRHLQPNIVVTGFVASDAQGRPTTLGRNGSDHSGAIFAVLFEADELTIWTDVDGVLSADPRLVPDAVCLPMLSYAEACELAYFGAKVLHPQTMAPAIRHELPIRIRNSRAPQAPGTLISAVSRGPDGLHGTPVKGLSLAEGLALLELSGAGLIGVPGTAERMFAALRQADVSVIMISQGSSEHSICCVVRQAQADAAREAVEAAFAEAIGDGQAQGVGLTPGIAVLAAVGDGMVGTPGVAARLLGGLAQARVNVRAIAQGAGERNISVAIAAGDAQRGLRAAHAAFWLSPQTLSVGLIGPGNVGRTLLRQLAEAAPRFAAGALHGQNLDLRLRAIANSRRMRLHPKALDPATAAGALLEDAEALDLDRFAAHIRAEHLPHAMIVDCSGSDAVAARYAEWLAAGIHVVTPNKQAGSGPLTRFQAIRKASRSGGQFRYEATVGAGLPVIRTLRDLIDTGDVLYEIEGLFSGTLAWLFNRFGGSGPDDGLPFSELVLEARRLGYTEPDPRDDLSGMDVARKLVILAREAGRELSLDDVEIENLVPEPLREIALDAFLERIGELDAPMQARLDAAGTSGGKLRYLARLDRDGRASVSLVVPPAGHASLYGRLTDNLIQFRTLRYPDNPLVVQGPGAGPEVTAAGVFGDILAIAQNLG